MASSLSLSLSPALPVNTQAPSGPFETVIVDTKSVACAGDGGVGGHPRVYLNMGPNTEVTCPYCSRHFVLHAAAPHHEQPQHRDAESGPPASAP